VSYPLTDIEGIDEETATILKSAGIRSTESLLDKVGNLRGRKAIAAKTEIPANQQALALGNLMLRNVVRHPILQPAIKGDTLLGRRVVRRRQIEAQPQQPGGVHACLLERERHRVLDDGQSASFSVQLADATGAIYRWTRNGTNIPGATNATLVIAPVSAPSSSNGGMRSILRPNQ